MNTTTRLIETVILDDATANVEPVELGAKETDYSKIGLSYALGLCPYQDARGVRQNENRDHVATVNREDLDRILASLGAIKC